MSDQPQSPKTTNALWGGRFDSAPSEIMQQINASIKFDKRLAFHDIAGSRAHADMLAAQGIITNSDRDAIQDGLKQIESEIRAGQLVEDPALEDIHMHIEARLAELIGDAAGRLHTARSRNDQVATDLRLWIRDAIDGLCTQITALRAALVDQAAAHVDTIMPGFTHLQTAQPVTLGHHLLAYVEMFSRDHGRFQDARNRVNESPLGAAALAGTSFPIDRHQTARELGFARPMANSLDAVSARDFVLEFLAAATIAAVNLSRLAEELVLWASPQFGFLTLSDRFSTGSSIMPQKRNPDAAELTRAKTGRILGNLTGLVTVLKALPLAYSKDMQEDKEATFDTLDSLQLCLGAMTGMIGDLKVDAARMEAAASAGFATATDLADWLVQTLGMPFRQAHHVTGQIVKLAEQHGCRLDQLKLDDLQSVEPAIDASVFGVLDVRQSVASRNSFGGTAPETVLAAIAAVRKSLS